MQKCRMSRSFNMRSLNTHVYSLLWAELRSAPASTAARNASSSFEPRLVESRRALMPIEPHAW